MIYHYQIKNLQLKNKKDFKLTFMKLQRINKNFNECIGKTPLIKLKIASQMSGCNIYGKCEFLNPGGSVKDRPGVADSKGCT